MGLLNSMRHFLMPSFGPALLNLAMIIACVWFVPRTHPGVIALAFGILIGGLLQIAIQIPVAMKMGFRFRFSWRSESSQKIMRLLGPRMVGSSVYQLNVFIDTVLASLSHIVGEGAVAALYFANRLVQLPLAMFGTASAQASLPALSEHASAGDIKSFHSILLSVLRMVAFVVLPSAFGLVALSYPIVKTLFERGAFDQNATFMTSQALVFYAAGLLGFSFNKVLTGAFYALHDTWTPVKLTMRAVAISLALSVLLMFPMRLSGIALAASIANTLNAYHLLRHIQRKLGRHMIKHLFFPIFKMVCASIIMALYCFGGWMLIGPALGQLVALPILIISGLFCYATCCFFFKVSELSSAFRWIRSACKSTAPCVSD
jgi:putative peptidoglycan lipid II flippase